MFDRKGRLDTGLKFFNSFLSKEVFLRGFTTAIFKSTGTEPEAREVLMIWVITGRRVSMLSYNSLVGIGSNSHDVGAVFLRMLRTNCSETGEKESRKVPEK